MSYQLIETESQLPTLFTFLEPPGKTLALDTEFVRTRTYYAKLGLVQLFDGHSCLLVDPVLLNMSDVWPLLERHHWVLHSFGEDLEILKKYTQRFGLSIFDTQVAASFAGYGISLGYQGLIREITGIEIDKGESRTDWIARPLTQRQLDYAAKDVIHLLPAADELKQLLDAKGLLAMAQEESERLAALKWKVVDPEFAYLDIKNAWRLSRQQLGILQVLACWRQKVAVERDLPINNVVQGESLWLLARHQPRNRNALNELGLGPQELRIHGQALLELVAEGCALGESEWPAKLKRMLDYTAYKPTMEKMREIVAGVERETGIPADVLASKRQYHELLKWHWQLTPRQREEGALPVLLTGWRGALLSPLLTVL
jgi:ribonuclease D